MKEITHCIQHIMICNKNFYLIIIFKNNIQDQLPIFGGWFFYARKESD